MPKTVSIKSAAADLGAHRDPRDLQEPRVVKCRIMIVDGNARARHEIGGILADMNHELIEAASTDEALRELDQQPVDLIVADVEAPGLGGIAFCERIRATERDRLVPVFIKAPANREDLEIRAITSGADEFLLEPVTNAALRARVHATLRYKFIMGSLDDTETVLFSLAKSVEDRDPDLGQHCQRLALMSAGIGISLGLAPAQIRTLHRGGYLHDIGKISIPDRILFKAGPLTGNEWEIMRSHPERGERMCAASKSLASVLPIIRHHHEKFDGSGYPDGLKGEQIPLLARILQVADIYDALTTERPYKRAYSSDQALDIMRQETERGWRDPSLVEAFADLLPVFRHPGLIDPTRLSLQALEASLEHYRRQSIMIPPVLPVTSLPCSTVFNVSVHSGLAALNREIVDCRLCPRLVRHREEVGQIKRRAYLDQTYWSRPITGFGDPLARLLIVGLAPGAHGANRTGRVFTGDSSGLYLYRALFETGFANQPNSVHPGDGLQLTDAYIACPVRCVPPDNKPLPEEVATCRPYMERELALLQKVEVVVALGGIALNAYLSTLLAAGSIVSRTPFAFGHGQSYQTHASGPLVLCSYHPSQQNTSTRRLTADMLRDIFATARSSFAGT